MAIKQLFPQSLWERYTLTNHAFQDTYHIIENVSKIIFAPIILDYLIQHFILDYFITHFILD